MARPAGIPGRDFRVAPLAAGAVFAVALAGAFAPGAARAEARGWQLLAESGRARFAERGADTVGTPLGLRAALGVATALDAQLCAAWSRHLLPATEDLAAAPVDVAALGAGLAYHLDELPVVPSLGLGPEAILVRSPQATDAAARVRLTVAVDWDVRPPLLVGVAAHFHYVPSDFPRSFYLVTVLSVGVHLDPPDYVTHGR